MSPHDDLAPTPTQCPSARSMVLVVEDDMPLAHTLDRVLQRAGYAVSVATDGRAGLAYAETGDVDLLLLDLTLPDLDGLELCRRVRARESGPYLPIILLTGQAEREHQGFLAGADDYLTKPFHLEALLDRVAVWLRTRRRLAMAHEQQQRLAAEQAAQARLEGVLLAVRTLEHELNNRLALTVGWSQVLATNAALPESLQRAARETLRGAIEAADIVQRLAQLTEIEEQQWGTELVPTIAVRRSSERAGPAQ